MAIQTPDTSGLSPVELKILGLIENNLSLVYGPIVVGGMLDGVLFGFMLVQFVFYCTRAGKADSKWMKGFVYALMVLGTIHFFYAMCYLMRTFAFRFGDSTAFFEYEWASNFYIFETVIMAPVEAFFAERAWRLWNRPLILTLLLPFLMVCLVAFGLALKVTALKAAVWSIDKYMLITWVAVLVFTEMLVSGLIVKALLKSRSGFKQTDKLINRIVFITVQAQLIPCVVAILFFLQAVILPGSPTSLAFMGVPKLWIISMLSVLNARYYTQEALEIERIRRQGTFNLAQEVVVHEDKPSGGGEVMDLASFINAESARSVPLSTPTSQLFSDSTSVFKLHGTRRSSCLPIDEESALEKDGEPKNLGSGRVEIITDLPYLDDQGLLTTATSATAISHPPDIIIRRGSQ